MRVPVERLSQVFGDRLLLKQLDRPEKVGTLYVPTAALKAKVVEQELWYGEVIGVGLDARYPEAYGIKVGDVLAVESLGDRCASFEGEDGTTYVWVAEEFIAAKDSGLIAKYRQGKAITSSDSSGLIPVGAYALIEPDPEETKRNGVVIPDTAKTPVRTGTVKSVSEGYINGQEVIGLRVKKDSSVLVGKYSGSWLRLGKTSFLLVKEEDVIAEMSPAKEVAHA